MCRLRSTTATRWAFSATTAPVNRPCCAYLPEFIEPTQGSIRIDGRVSPLFSTSPGLVTDDTGYENVVTCGLLLGMTRDEIERKLPEIEAFTELSDYLALPVRTYSSGMLVRLGFAIATAIDPEILLLDEGLGAGDARFATRAANRVKALIERSSIMVLASHSDELIRQMCKRAILLDRGQVIADGPTEEVLEIYARMNRGEPPQPLPAPPAEEREQASGQPAAAVRESGQPANCRRLSIQANTTSRGER